MELSAKYAYKVYKEKSFSAAAKALCVSQPALSATVSRLEKELGIRIFDRSKLPLTLTGQGRIYMQAVEEMLESENIMRRKLRELSDMSSGSISVGCSGFASCVWMPQICGAFHKQYPQIKVTLDIGDADALAEKLAGNALDLMLTDSADESKFTKAPITDDRLIIAMHKDMPGAKALAHLALNYREVMAGEYARELEDLSIFADIPFIPYAEHSDIAKRMSRMLGSYKTAFCQVENAPGGEMHYNLMCSGMGAVVTTQGQLLQKEYSAQDILFFVPKSEEAHRSMYLAARHSASDDPVVQNFIQVARETCGKNRLN